MKFYSVMGLAAILFAGTVAVSAQEMDNGYAELKQAVEKKDVAAIKKLATETSKLARQVIDSKQPDGMDKATWDEQVSHAKEIDVYTEYALYATAIQAPAATTVDLMSTLEQQNPKSKYLAEGYGRYFSALSAAGQGAKVPAIADKAIANFPENADLLALVADRALSSQQFDRAMTLARRLVATGKNLNRGYYILGLAANGAGQFAEANKALRAALPLVKGNDNMTGTVLFNLGVANYQLGRRTANKAMVFEGAKFSEQAAQVKFPMMNQAAQNARVMRAEAMKMP
jgi:tetratricopeptide (TPR) repeat protein